MNQLVYALLVIPMILILATAVYQNFSANINQAGWTGVANATKTSIDSGTWNGFALGSMLPYIYIAVTVIAVILGAFGLSKVF